MSVRRGRWLRGFLAVVMLAVVACGDDDDGTTERSVKDKALENFGDSGLAEAEVVVQAYEEGRLGSQAEVEADMEPYFNRPDTGLPPTPKPFDDAGNILPFGEMTDEQARNFNLWSNGSQKVNAVVGLEKQRAVADVIAKRQQDDG